MIHVIAIIAAKPGKRDQILRHFRTNVPAVRAEKGCIEYGAAVDAENALKFQTKWGPDTFLVIEKWESMAALQAHAAAPHMAAYGASTKELIASRRSTFFRRPLDRAHQSARLNASLPRPTASTQLGIPGDLSGYRTSCAGLTAVPRMSDAPS